MVSEVSMWRQLFQIATNSRQKKWLPWNLSSKLNYGYLQGNLVEAAVLRKILPHPINKLQLLIYGSSGRGETSRTSFSSIMGCEYTQYFVGLLWYITNGKSSRGNGHVMHKQHHSTIVYTFLMILHSFFHIFCDIIPDIWGGIIVGLFKTDPSKITYSKPFKTRFEIPDLLLPTVKSNFPS